MKKLPSNIVEEKDGSLTVNVIGPSSIDYIWTAPGTDIEERWRVNHGWVRPSESPEYQAKWKHFQELPMRKLDDLAKARYEEVLKRAKVARIR